MRTTFCGAPISVFLPSHLQRHPFVPKKTTEIVSLFDGMYFSLEDMNMNYSRHLTGPVERDEMMGYAEMISNSLVEENKTNIGKLSKELN